MKAKPMPHYILVRCNKEEQKKRKEKAGRFYTHTSHQFMVYNMEWGEIVSVGEECAKILPQAKKGHTLIFHHFVQGESKADSKKEHLVHEDKTYHYYVVTTERFNGKRNETYGVWDGEKIIPHPEFIFLELDSPKESKSGMSVSASGIILFDNWNETADDKREKMGAIKERNHGLALGGVNKEEVRQQIEKNEREMAKMGEDLTKKTYTQYIIAYHNPALNEFSNRPIQQGEAIYMETIGAAKIINFRDKEYRIGTCEFIGWIGESLPG